MVRHGPAALRQEALAGIWHTTRGRLGGSPFDLMRVGTRQIGWFFGGLLVLIAGAAAVDWWVAYPPEVTRRYVGRQNCVRCHAEQGRQWTGSHHDLAMDHATPETVRGDFNNRTFTYRGVTSRMFRRGDRFLVTTDGPEGTLQTFEVEYTFGYEPLQQYLVALDRGRIQALPIAWDTERQRWFHLYPDESIDHNDPLHWTKPAQNWNYMCAECHSTDVHKNFDVEQNAYHTTFSEIDVSCEACHGPGSLHVEMAEGHALFWDRRHGHGLAKFDARDNDREIEVCARCHARRRVLQDGYEPGKPLLDYYAPRLIDDGTLYFADGQIRDEVYVYGSFLQSRMYREGVRCTDCHDPHTARLKREGNRLCAQCHVPAKYDTPSHHHHRPESRGARCVECHMPERTYMVVDPRRDHSLRIPRPDLTVSLGTPNACDRCHDQQGAAWAAERVAEWYPKTADRRRPHFAHAIAAGREGRPEAIEPLMAVARRKDVGPLVRASAVALLGRYAEAEAREAVQRFLSERNTLVRASAVAAFEGRDLSDRRTHLPPLLDDPRYWVRTEAARLLAPVDPRTLSPQTRQRLDVVLEQYLAGQLATADHPAAHLNRAVIFESRGRVREAIAEYEIALRIDPTFAPARHNLAMLLDNLGRPQQAEAQLRELLKHHPDDAQGVYSLALVVAEDSDRLNEAAQLLGRAAELLPDRARVHYNHGLALQQLGRWRQAEAALRRAAELEPGNADFLYALAVHYLERGRVDAADEWLARMKNAAPDDPRVAQLNRWIEQQRRQPQRPASEPKESGPQPPAAAGPPLPDAG